MGTLKFRALVLFIISVITLFGNVKQMNTIADNAIVELNKKGFYTNGDYEYGILAKGKAHYATMTLYKGNSYAFVVGVSANVKKLNFFIFNENMLNLQKKESIDSNGYKIITVTPEKTGTYYLKLHLIDGAENDCEWISLYGFKKK